MLKLCYIADVPQLEVLYTQLMYQNCGWPKKFTPLQQEITINNISNQQLNNVIILLQLYHIYNVFMDLAWYFCKHVLLMKLSCI